MQGPALVARAAAPAVATVRAITTGQLDSPTPCDAYDVRQLLGHLLYWGPSLEGAALGGSAEPPTTNEQDVDLTGGDWVGGFEAQVDRIVSAWSKPAAWEGTTRMGGPTPLPAAMVGGMAITELVVHGWDLARATGARPRWDSEVLDFAHRELERTAEQGRQMGVYGPAVPVPGTASVLDRALGLTGRDPGWTAPG